MERLRLFSLDTPYREPMTIDGYGFGPANAPTSVAIVGSLRGNEVQQAFICASLVAQLQAYEAAGQLTETVRVLIIPTANPFSMNIARRFWPMDNTDINRMFPGYDQGETTQRIAAGLFDAIKGFTYGIQLCSYYLPGEFEPHVRVTDSGALNLEPVWSLARLFGFPYAMLKEASPFDTTTLNYNWQVWGTYAFSLFSASTDCIDMPSAHTQVRCIERFLTGVGALDITPEGEDLRTVPLKESDLAKVHSAHAGFFQSCADVGERVSKGARLAEILSTEDCSVREVLTSPCDGKVFFRHGPSLINAGTIAFQVAPTHED